MSIALVDALNFEKNMPIDGNCRQQIAVSVPCTGAQSYNMGTYFMINLPVCGPDYCFDPMNSFLRFKATNIDAAGVLMLGHSADSFFQKLEVMHAGNLLECIDNYQQLSAMVMDSQEDSSIRNTCFHMSKGSNVDSTATTINPAGTKWFSTTLISGIVGSLARNYIPTGSLLGSLQKKITLSNYQQLGQWSTAPNTTSNANFSISDIEFHSNFIKLSPEVMSMIQSPEYTIYSESYTNFQQSVPITSAVEQLIPSRYSSLKSVFVSMRKQVSVLNANYLYFPNTRSTFAISDYCFRLGPEQIPPVRVRCHGYGYVEPYESLKVCLHSGGNTLTSMGIINGTNYIIAQPSGSGTSADTYSNGGLFIIGQDFETYGGKSGALLSGASTVGSDLYFSATFSTATPAAIFDYFMHYDIKLIIQDGVLTVHV